MITDYTIKFIDERVQKLDVFLEEMMSHHSTESEWDEAFRTAYTTAHNKMRELFEWSVTYK